VNVGTLPWRGAKLACPLPIVIRSTGLDPISTSSKTAGPPKDCDGTDTAAGAALKTCVDFR
jgi:hypothetical protein